MNSSTRVILNTTAQYVKTFANIVLALYSARLILDALGVTDFGLYSLIAGITSMLAFATNALASTTQRFLSFHQGKTDIDEQKNIFANSFYIQVSLGLITLIVLLAITPLLFNGVLNIPEERTDAAIGTYIIVTLILFTTFLCTPYRAVLISHENIIYLTIIDVIDGVLKVLLALVLFHIHYDRLIGYSYFMLFIQIFNLSTIALFALYKYEECIIPSLSRISKKYILEISSFAGWNIYNVGCIMGRTQGIAILLNHFFGAAVNAAYGLGFQIAGYINFMSESLLNAIRPQIVRSEGEGNRLRMLWLSEIASKFSFFLLSCLAIPCAFEMPTLLNLWLGTVPEYAVLFCRMVLIASVVDTLTCGLGIANQAIGNIKQYSLAVNTVKLLTLPTAYICIRLGLPIIGVAICYVGFEFLCALIRIPFVSKTGKLNIQRFVTNVFGREVFPFIIFLSTTYFISNTIDLRYRFIITFSLSIIVYMVTIYFWGLTKEERSIINQLITSLKNRL